MRWSLSSLGTFEKCQLKYKFQNIDKLPSPRGTAANRGVDVHKHIEDFISGKTQALPTEINYWTQTLTQLREQGATPEVRISLTREWSPTEWDAANVWVRGILDLRVTSESEGQVYDWKTGKIYPDHDDQKSLYSAMLLSSDPELQRVRATHVYIDLNQRREKVFARDDLPDLRKHWEVRASFLERTAPEDMIPSPGYHCRYCAFSKSKGGPCRF